MSRSKIKVLIHSNYSRLVTGFGKNMRNILMALHEDPEMEVVEAANGVSFGLDLQTPWESYGTYPSDSVILNKIHNDPAKKRVAQYGYYTIDSIIEKVKPDIYLGIEDIWAFREFENKEWWKKTKTILWTTLDSSPILHTAKDMYSKCDKMLVWASFAEREMKDLGCKNTETIHGAVSYQNFRPLKNRKEVRNSHRINDEFIIGFVFKNQLRKSVPNLLEGFKLFKQKNPEIKAKLLLHTDWSENKSGWDIPRYLDEKQINKEDVLSTYLCHECSSYYLSPYQGEDLNCPNCVSEKSVKTKTSAKGVSEEQLNEIYNIMDVYCHPFTSGGQELPIQEAKAAGLITLVTNYSCGEDSCHNHQGGIPLSWHEYREPSTQFIKASTDPESICEELDNVFKMTQTEKNELIRKGQENIRKEFSVEETVFKLKKTILDIHSKKSKRIEKIQEDKKEDEEQVEEKHFSDMLDDEGAENRILVVSPATESGTLMINSLLKNIQKNYIDKKIYLAINPKLKQLVEDNANVHKILPYHNGFDNPSFLEGQGKHIGYFDIAFMPNLEDGREGYYCHNGKEKIQFF
jgi:glycosyltransferase involved in cell wall biosynthesis